MKIIKCIHVTATEKRQLKEFFKSGLQDAKIGRKMYSIISSIQSDEKKIYKIRITTPMRDDYNRRIYDEQIIEVIN